MISELATPPVNGPTPGGVARPHKRWSRDEEKFLCDCTHMGFNASQLAPLLERSADALSNKRNELGVRLPNRLPRVEPEPDSPHYFVRDIQAIVAEFYRVPISFMTAPSGPGKNARLVSLPRQIAMFLATEMTDHTLTRIGQFFGGRDHTTVRHARIKIGALISKLGPTRYAVRDLTALIERKNAEEYGLAA